MSCLVDCTFRRDFQHTFPGIELPALTFLSSFEDDNGYCMSTRDCIKQDEDCLREEKRRLEQKLAQVTFTLDWLEMNKEELLRISETERLYENPDEETDIEFDHTKSVYANSSVCARKSSLERPPLPSPRPDQNRYDDKDVPIHGPPEIKKELEEVLRIKSFTSTRTLTNQRPGSNSQTTRSLTAGNNQSTDTFPRNPAMASDGSSMVSKQNDTAVCRNFLFSVRMNADSGYSADKDKLSFRKNETMDVVEEWSTPMQEFYRVRNSCGQLGVVPKQLCQRSSSDQSVLWGRPWFHQNITRQQADSLLGSCPGGSFLIRDSKKEIGNFVLSLKTRNSVGHYVITTHPKGYKFCNKDFISLDALIDHFRKSTLDKGTSLISSPLKS
ncbi:Cytoplasmic protein NCK2 [Holothuria leucospilota]|uniref:Cytoplasmic protein NCK2 n=1 Tax=Holothuria leucospilota TaxID=206669 RepID=A0A9Q1BC01_HOLLE|nr:Cytoplasmic protein NCK2 [Holothuria leucospilota]